MVLWDKAGQSQEAWISMAGLIDKCKMNVHTVKAAIKWLQENGYVKKIERPGRVNHYELSIEGSLTPGSEEPRAPESLGLSEAGGTPGSQEPPELQTPETSEPIYGAAAGNALAKRLVVGEALHSHSDKILEFFNKHKSGKKTIRAFHGLLAELAKILNDPSGGSAAVSSQLQRAIDSSALHDKKWASITYENWKRFGQLPQRQSTLAQQAVTEMKIEAEDIASSFSARLAVAAQKYEV
jgi:hypothetical protein